MSRSTVRTLWAVLALILILPWLPLPAFWLAQLNYIGLFAMTSLGLVLLTGVAGLTSFGQAAFVGVGAYAAGYMVVTLNASPWLALVVSLAFRRATPFRSRGASTFSWGATRCWSTRSLAR